MRDWRGDPASDKQKEALKRWGLAPPATKGECSDLISKYKSAPIFQCKTCKGFALVEFLTDEMIKVSCCGKSNRYGSPYSKDGMKYNGPTVANEYAGSHRTGTGEAIYHRGHLEYMDDGNGNVFDSSEEYDDHSYGSYDGWND